MSTSVELRHRPKNAAERNRRLLLAAWAALLALCVFTIAYLLAVRVIVTSQQNLQGQIVLPAGNIAAPGFQLHDEDGRPVSLADERGKVVVLSFLDSTCTNLCPLQANDIAVAQRSLGSQYPFVLLTVSVAPNRDTPSNVRAFASIHGWTGDWHWLLGSESQLARVWKAYGVYVIDPRGKGQVQHTAAVLVIDPQGYERVGFVGGFSANQLATDIRQLEPEPIWNRLF